MPALRNKLTAIAAIGAAALGGSAIANAASSSSSTSTTPAAGAATQQAPQRDPSRGGHQANGKTEQLLTGATASKVEAAAKAKLPGATIQRVENDADTGSAYEAHVTQADGSEAVVYVDASFNVTSVGTIGHP
jgi:uncharacterized membrane protein YkoI